MASSTSYHSTHRVVLFYFYHDHVLLIALARSAIIVPDYGCNGRTLLCLC
ncbi:hypothetical protein PAHAL_8G111500 [Panicum hallii]|uniref:Uncharacterized protein n=1 Tax=Panicum hallii TaxID=206008 RepID=A0A2T8I8I4_9POAL|nr:hypothetical protein PAHAL_8G111500 [Panicum hallii]